MKSGKNTSKEPCPITHTLTTAASNVATRHRNHTSAISSDNIRRMVVAVLISVSATLFANGIALGQLCSQSIRVDSSAAVQLPNPLDRNLRVGDQVVIQARLHSEDINETGEAEPLSIQHKNNRGEVVSEDLLEEYDQNYTVYTKVQTGGFINGSETFSALILGADDEYANVTLCVNKRQLYPVADKQAAAKVATLLRTHIANALSLYKTFCMLHPVECVEAGFELAPWLSTTGTVVGVAALVLDTLASDPSDPNFTQIVTPEIPSLPLLTARPGITTAEADAYNQLLMNAEQIIGYGQAIFISLNRAQGAIDASNTVWETAQLAAVDQYNSQLVSLLSALPQLLTNLQNSLNARGFPSLTLTPDDALTFEQDIAFNGLSSDVVQTLVALGLDSTAIDQFREAAIVQDVNEVAGTIPAQLTDPSLICAINQAAFVLGGAGTPPAPPTITCPKNIVAPFDPLSSSAAVIYTVTATNTCDNVPVRCLPPSGSDFPLGNTTVTCTADDDFFNTATCTFTVTVGFKCPKTQGFWKNNPNLWLVSSLTLGNQTYTEDELRIILRTPTTTDASLILARQLIAAKLNIANSSDPTPVASTIAHADSLLSAFSAKLPYKVKPSSTIGQAMANDASKLDDYNSGKLTKACLQ